MMCSVISVGKMACGGWRVGLLERVGHRGISVRTPCRRFGSGSGVKRQSNSIVPPQLEGMAVGPSGPRLWKPLVFTVCFSGASLGAATIWQYETTRAARESWWSRRRKAAEWRDRINRWWHSLEPPERVFIPLCLANCLVFLAWRVPRFQPSLVKYFCSTPCSSVLCWPMILSVFSHYSLFHLFANMYVLHSFTRIAVHEMGREQFLGFYMCAGVVSSLASYVHKAMLSRPGLSLGASGAVMAVLAHTCARHPDLDLSVIFLPMFTFKAATALKAILALDAAGVVLGWKVFDHAAHLGGALFGLFWATWGYQHVWLNRKPIVEAWHQFRGPP